MKYDEAKTAMIGGIAVACNGRRYRIAKICEVPVARLNTRARIAKQNSGNDPTVHLLELINDANCIEYEMMEAVSLA